MNAQKQAPAAPPPDELQQLAERVQHLCARCERLHRDNKLLRQENRRLQNRCEKAKQQLGELIAALPDYE